MPLRCSCCGGDAAKVTDMYIPGVLDTSNNVQYCRVMEIKAGCVKIRRWKQSRYVRVGGIQFPSEALSAFSKV